MSILSITQAYVVALCEELGCKVPVLTLGLKPHSSINLTLVPNVSRVTKFIDGSSMVKSPIWVDYRVTTNDDNEHERAIKIMGGIMNGLVELGMIDIELLTGLRYEAVVDPHRTTAQDSKNIVDFRMQINANYFIGEVRND